MQVKSLLFWSLCWASTASALPAPVQGPSCDCTGTKNGGKEAKSYICRDSRLGPAKLPRKLPLGTLVSSYDRFGGLKPGEFLAQWTDANGNYVYPPQNGFQLDAKGNAINGTMVLEPGTLVDRFGSEYGSYISAAAAPYSQRALPPSNLDTNQDAPEYPYNYHIYEVLKPLTVVGGPIAPWFGQPGLGAQFYTGGTGNIMALIAAGYLEREDPDVLIAKSKGC
ncbi:hypothetical protein BGZ61DRAFT_455988 [Ilyonectria robusta]|uniref:uncharacterized protein n=1 Tax=Ilyonectria robusta TaxID=1079257 RepID=UPI001E8CBE3E|nr:uncharacterized protein BGZ61DRAFT_455988 [Ilyonectria robusta]KAH6984564.1 hypothetical protein BKA56DRAFT_671066 [Ilyonectria sp. MPI-CAGE-AT-0026]KAH8683508.1 hypothetical protein BGZ61DRAFT_455988 [Ilyonectria robusta]